MADGIVKWFDDKKGYGFIESEGKDFFVHFREIQKTGFKSLKPDDSVTFIPLKSDKGLSATKVHLKY
jgi:CspA family cold shock protein